MGKWPQVLLEEDLQYEWLLGSRVLPPEGLASLSFQGLCRVRVRVRVRGERDSCTKL